MFFMSNKTPLFVQSVQTAVYSYITAFVECSISVDTHNLIEWGYLLKGRRPIYRQR